MEKLATTPMAFRKNVRAACHGTRGEHLEEATLIWVNTEQEGGEG